jgi:outer membrane protein TolC
MKVIMLKLKYISAYVLLFLNIFLCSITVRGQQPPEDSLKYYLQVAVKNNPAVLQRFAEYEAALQKIPQAGSLPDPELNIGVFLTPMELVEGRQVADFRLMQMFPWFNTLRAAKDEMSLMAKAKYESFIDAKLQVCFDVQRTWFEVYKISQDLRISKKNIDILKSIERLSIVRFKSASTNGINAPGNMNSESGSSSQSSGTGMQEMAGNNSVSSASNIASPVQSVRMGAQAGGSGLADVYRIQMEIEELENNISSLGNEKISIVARFNSFLNRPLQMNVTIDTLMADLSLISNEVISDSLLIHNPMLDMLQFEKESIEARRIMVAKMGNPMIGIGVNYSLINKNEMLTSEMNGKDMIMPMVTLTLPIYRKKYKSREAETEFMKEAVQQNYTNTANALQSEYYQAIQLYRDAVNRNRLYTHHCLLANSTLDILLKNYSVAGGSLTDILLVRKQRLDYEFKKVEATVDYNTAVAWMKRLAAITLTE